MDFDTFKKNRRAFYGEVVKKDCYLLRRWQSDFFDYIVDIGANVGVFTLYAHMRHPGAKIYAYEPCESTYISLVENGDFMGNIEFNQEALGDGSQMSFFNTGYAGCNQFFKMGEKDVALTDSVKSISLSDIFKTKNIPLDSNYFIKIDCEGGERFLLDDSESIGVIKKSQGTAIEVHFPPKGINLRPEEVERFKSFPVWEYYNHWFRDNFEDNHDIVYHCSDKRRGSGVFVLLRKNEG